MGSACTAPRIAIAIVALALTSPFDVCSSAQESCPDAMKQFDHDLQEFQKDARTEGLNFLENDIAATDRSVDAILDAVLRQNPDEFYRDAADLKQMMGKLYAQEQQLEGALGDVEQCLNTKDCSLMALAARQNEALRQWIQSLASRGVQDALRRVKKAQQILQNYVKRLGGMASGSMGAAADCVNQYQRRVRNPQTNIVPAAVTAPSRPKPHGLPAAVTVPIIAGGAFLVSDVIVKKVCGVDLWNATNCGNPTPDPNGNTGGWAFVGSTPFVCGSRQCSSGSITLNVPVAVTKGFSWVIAAQGSGGGYLTGVATTNGQGHVTYDFRGSQSALICAPITFIKVYDGYTNTGTFLNTVDVSVPVSCQ